MKVLACAMCNSKDIVEKNDKYICNYCGTIYSSETVRKLILSGSVSIDDSRELENLCELAGRARASHNHTLAAKYYEMILMKAPNRWDAYFYATYCSAMTKKITELDAATALIRHCIPHTLKLLQQSEMDNEQLCSGIEEIRRNCYTASQMLRLLCYADGDDTEEDNSGLRDCFCMEICKRFEDNESVFYPHCTDILKNRLEKPVRKDYAEAYRSAIRRYEPNYGQEVVPKKRTLSSDFGCYIATAVYGSYDCPPVWTLRRFRDEWLSKSWYGRGFIRLYYAISPHMVRRFGHMQGLCRFVRGRLDRLVAKLQSKGYESTPYRDPKE